MNNNNSAPTCGVAKAQTPVEEMINRINCELDGLYNDIGQLETNIKTVLTPVGEIADQKTSEKKSVISPLVMELDNQLEKIVRIRDFVSGIKNRVEL